MKRMLVIGLLAMTLTSTHSGRAAISKLGSHEVFEDEP
jgi:hypothetical protein